VSVQCADYGFVKPARLARAILMSKCLENMMVLVTGASSGIGRATASILARFKARVVLVGRRHAVLDLR
jgi:NADPH:quinone reductase-like Zn-dependent oxidoreductase